MTPKSRVLTRSIQTRITREQIDAPTFRHAPPRTAQRLATRSIRSMRAETAALDRRTRLRDRLARRVGDAMNSIRQYSRSVPSNFASAIREPARGSATSIYS